MLTFENWISQWMVDSDHTPTPKEIDAMRDAWNGALETIADAAKDYQAITDKKESKAEWSARQPT